MESFFDLIFGDEGTQHLSSLAQLRRSGHPDIRKQQNSFNDTISHAPVSQFPGSQTSMFGAQQAHEKALGMLHGGKFSARFSFASVKSKTNPTLSESSAPVPVSVRPRVIIPESRALVPVPARAFITIPPIWFDVIKAIMIFYKENPEVLASTARKSSLKSVTIATADSQGKEPIINGQVTVHASMEEKTPLFERGNQKVLAMSPRVVTDEKPTNVLAEGQDSRQGGRKNGRHRTEQERQDRQERKRRKKEKRERKKQKKAERKEGKRHARENNDPAVELIEAKNKVPHEPAIEWLFPNKATVANIEIEDKRRIVGEMRALDVIPTGTGLAPDVADSKVASDAMSEQGGQVRQYHSNSTFISGHLIVDGRNNKSGKRGASVGKHVLDVNRATRNPIAVIDVDDLYADAERTREKKRRKKEKNPPHSSELPRKSADEVDSVETAMPTMNNMTAPVANTRLMNHVVKMRATVKETIKENLAVKHCEGKRSRHPKNLNASRDATRQGHRPNDDGSALHCMTTAPVGNESHMNLEEDDRPQLRALCSESFFEEWSDTIALLASGQWFLLCQPQKTNNDTPPSLGPRIQLFDTPLLDEGGVDIELPGHAIIIYRLSSWGTTENAANVCAKCLVRLAALEVYKDIDVIICADVDITPALSVEMAFVQNSVVRQSGINSCSPTFQVVVPYLLAPVVASRVLSTRTQGIPADSFINGPINDVRVQERARFLLAISPSLSVCGALQCIMCLVSEDEKHEDDFTSQAFQRLVKNSDTIDRRLFGNEKLFEVNASALRQLAISINVPLNGN